MYGEGVITDIDLKEQLTLTQQELDEYKQYKRLYTEALDWLRIANDRIKELEDAGLNKS